ncbi:DNA replication regulator SLD3-domain-containing protein [Plectosphaerella plurivora]|uniref:DNA replication regulator SLD3-domain-containing protein n=1 Tax=Plectosphaerella plurivora TaxID=936078 RepID=A0A9P9A7C8_9PEZI|nr:DNA replication regulator SLD3-domain-containing protein [Plectosphaerella plurivora]
MPLPGQIASSDVPQKGPPGVLTPSSDGSLNRIQHPANDGKPRPRMNSNALESLLRSTFVVKAYPSHPLSKPRTLQPLMLLAREDLPLASIDFTAPHGDLQPSRFFESHIKILELEERMAEKASVLIARTERSSTLYAVERNGRKLFTICKLGSWVKASELAAKATVSIARLFEPQPRESISRAPSVSDSYSQPLEKRQAIEALQSAVRKRARSQSLAAFDETARADKRQRSDDDVEHKPSLQEDAPPSQKESSFKAPSIMQQETQPPSSATIIQGDVDVQAEPTKESIFENITSHYMEILYRSKGSLAYFVKGPLSRARAAFHLDYDSTLDMNDLIEFLKSLTVSTVQVDKKYRVTIPEIITRTATLVETSDEGGRAKKKKPRKMKIAKNGLYPGEESQIKKWWLANKPELTADETSIPPAQITSHVELLRARETELQIIVILEILALQLLHAREANAEGHLPGLGGDAEPQKEAAAPVSKKRNKDKLSDLVECHADRLCIWQSTASDELRQLEDSQVPVPPTAGGQAARRATADTLKDFCTDIILPFFAVRIPEQCDKISRKLGGPVIISSPKPQRAKPASKKPEAKPGAATKRLSSSLNPRAIERALNKEQSRRSISRGPASTIALLRSATSTVIPGLKRENSESSLRDMAGPGRASHDPPKLLSSGNNLAKEDAKAQKKAMVDAQLRDAISVLRRPNREMAGKSIMEAAEKRSSGGLSSTRKTKKPTRHPLFQRVEVKATPVHNRFRDAMADDSLDDGMIPPSSVSVIPGTVRRSSTKDFLSTLPSSAVRETPTKAMTSRRTDYDDESAIPPSSPLMMRRPAPGTAAPSHQFVRPRAVVPRSPSPNGMRRIFATPVKAKPAPPPLAGDNEEDEIAATPLTKPVPVPKKSIFEQLGWDDELDDL